MRCSFCAGETDTGGQCRSCGRTTPISFGLSYTGGNMQVGVNQPLPAPDPRDALIEQMGEALKRSKWTLEKFKDDKNDDSVSPTATATIPQDEPYIHLNMVESALAAWEKYKEAHA